MVRLARTVPLPTAQIRRSGSGEANNEKVVRGADGVLDQGSLADSCFATDHQGCAATFSRRCEQVIEHRAFLLAANQVHAHRP